VIVDGLIHLGVSHFGTSLSVDEALAAMDENGTHLAVAAPVHPSGADFPGANQHVLDAATTTGRFVPLARVDPWTGTAALAELERAVAAGARGLFLDPAEEHFAGDAPMVRPVVEKAAELGVPIVIAAGFHLYSEPPQLSEVASWVPDVPVVLTNGGQFNISGGSNYDALLTLRERPNVVVQTSAMYREDFLKSVIEIGEDRLMFATAAPRLSWRYERARVDVARFGAAEELVLGGTAARVFGVR
jgi:predicted TIM-barrel fold metal-dependent hydrolase